MGRGSRWLDSVDHHLRAKMEERGGDPGGQPRAVTVEDENDLVLHGELGLQGGEGVVAVGEDGVPEDPSEQHGGAGGGEVEQLELPCLPPVECGLLDPWLGEHEVRELQALFQLVRRAVDHDGERVAGRPASHADLIAGHEVAHVTFKHINDCIGCSHRTCIATSNGRDRRRQCKSIQKTSQAS